MVHGDREFLGQDHGWDTTLEPHPLDSGDSPALTELIAAAEGAGTLRERVEACQRAAIEQALAAHRGRWAGAARELGLDPSNLHKLAQRLGCAPARQR